MLAPFRSPLPAFNSSSSASSSSSNENLHPTTIIVKPLNVHRPAAGNVTFKPFKTPGAAGSTRVTAIPPRKRRKVNYAGADGDDEDGEPSYTTPGAVLTLRDANRMPVFKVKDKDTVFRTHFAVPLVKKSDEQAYNPRPPPALGMRRSIAFIPKALHDPAGEFAIVLYDPTIDDKKPVIEEILDSPESTADSKKSEKAKPKTLAEILGIVKDDKKEIPKVAVVIDPRLAKVLRPHQVEGVKVGYLYSFFFGCFLT